MNTPVSLVDKYRPRDLHDLVLPERHGLAASIKFCDRPYASAWLHHGPPGLGKTSLADIQARRASRPTDIHRFSGPDLSVDSVRRLAEAFVYRPLYGDFHTVVVQEADSIPKISQIRLLDLLDDLAGARLVMVFTSNDNISDFEARFVSRLKPQSFTSQGIAPPATSWLLRIAALENIPLTPKEAKRIIKLSCSNLRTALQELELLGAERRIEVPSVLPDAPIPCNLVAPTTGKAAANSRPTAAH
jgi:replication-associated recombination protein RarA